MFACEEKIAFVTGALGVIGRAYTKHLLLNKVKGVALIDVQEANATYQEEIDAAYGPGKCIYIKADISKTPELRGAFEKTVQHFGQLDIVINNAGIANEDDYEQCLQVNFIAAMNGTVMAMREYLPKYKKGSGVIVNTASIAGVVPFSFPVYCITKHAVAAIGLCYANNDECRKQDIRVLAICPGPTPSPLFSHLIGLLDHSDQSAPEINIANSSNADYLGEGLVQIMREGNNGAVWMFLEGKQPYKVDYKSIHDGAWNYLLGK